MINKLGNEPRKERMVDVDNEILLRAEPRFGSCQ